MATVPKLNYAKIRNHSKTKQQPHSQTSNLFSHMNQDNLNYIQMQIKHKNKNKTSLRPKSSLEQEQPNNYHIMSHRQIQSQTHFLQPPSQSFFKEQTQLSEYQLITNNKPIKLNSNHNNNNLGDLENNKFINFIEGYIDQLKKTKKKSKDKENDKDYQKQNNQQSKINQRLILANKLKEEQIAKRILSNQLQKCKSYQYTNTLRLDRLQQNLAIVIEQFIHFKSQLQKSVRVKPSPQQSQHFYESRLPSFAKKNKETFVPQRSRQFTESSSIQKLQKQYQQFLRKGITKLKVSSNFNSYRN